jgi:hypothetical protein
MSEPDVDTGADAAPSDQDGTGATMTAGPEDGTPADDARQRLQSVKNEFNGPVYAGDGTVLGFLDGGFGQPARNSGTLADREIDDLLRHYVPPEPYDSAVEALAADGVVALTGPRGTGKRAGGVSLLREVTGGRLVLLSPSSTLKQLAAREYEKGRGYLAADPPSEMRSADLDFTWLILRNQVKEAGAFLVVTTTSPPKGGDCPDSVKHVAWQQPDPRRVLVSHLAGTAIEPEIADRAAGAITADHSMTDIAALATVLASGSDVEKALDTFTKSWKEHIRRWFDDRGRTDLDFVQATVLAFFPRCFERTFESLTAKLNARLEAHFVVGSPDTEEPTKSVLRPERATRAGDDDGVIRTVPAAAGEIPRRTVMFRAPEYQSQVIVELASRFPAQFWDAVRDWLGELVREGSGPLPASGLAMLARVDFHEVEVSFLDPWSRGAEGWNGTFTAVHVLWWMCADEVTMQAALQTAVRWANHGDQAQQWTAAAAFSGQLGVCFPTDAVRHLWRLMTQVRALRQVALTALSGLFVTQVESTLDCGAVLVMLEHKVARLAGPGVDRWFLDLTLTAVLDVLSARSSRTGQPVVPALLHARPDRADQLARLWAAVLRNRRYRRRALEALWETLTALQQVSPDARAAAVSLGESLAVALPPGEHDSFRAEFLIVDGKRRRPSSGSLVTALLTALERSCQKKD